MSSIPYPIITALCFNSLIPSPMPANLSSIILSFFVCAITGVFFGWYPAKKAAALDPIQALRYE